MTDAALVYHPALLDALGLVDPGDFEAQTGTGKTTRMKLQALHALVSGEKVVIVAYSIPFAHKIVTEISDWCERIGLVLEIGQLRGIGTYAAARMVTGFEGRVFVDQCEHAWAPPRGLPRVAHRAWWSRLFAWLLRVWSSFVGGWSWSSEWV